MNGKGMAKYNLVISLSEDFKLIVDGIVVSVLYCETTMEHESHTLIKSGGGNRPYDARQPVSDELTKVLLPTKCFLHFER